MPLCLSSTLCAAGLQRVASAHVLLHKCRFRGLKGKGRSVAFPAISTGAYGYPMGEAAEIAVDTVTKHCPENLDVVFCCFSGDDLKIYRELLETYTRSN